MHNLTRKIQTVGSEITPENILLNIKVGRGK